MNRLARLLLGAVIVLLGLGLLAAYFLSKPPAGQLAVKLFNRPTVMPAASKVYGNPAACSGRYWLSKAVIENTGMGPLRNLKVSFCIPDYLDWTTPETYPELLPGQTVVLPYYPRLPASVTKLTSVTNAQVQMRLEYDGGDGHQSKLERRDFQFRGLNEIEYSSLPQSEIVTMDDANDLAELNGAWVTEEDPVVKAYYAKVAEVSGGFGTMGNSKDITQLGKSVYDYMCQTGMTYSGTKGVPEKVGDNWTLVQSCRLPRDVIYNNTALCIELTTLWAAIAHGAGADVALVFIPGHAFPVLIAGDGSMLPIEATGIGGAGGNNLGKAMPFDQAVKVATDNLNKVLRGEQWGQVFKISQLRGMGIRPPELGDVDRPALVKLLDERLAKRQQGGGTQVVTNANGPVVAGQGGQQNPDEPPPQPVQPQPAIANGQPWQDPQGRIAFAYPRSWIRNDQQVQLMRAVFPGYAVSVIDPNTSCGVDVVFFDGVNDPQQVLAMIHNAYQQMGVQLQVGNTAPMNVAGRGCTVVNVSAMTQNGPVGGAINIIPTRTGMMTFAIGGPQQTLQMAGPAFQQILASVRLGN